MSKMKFKTKMKIAETIGMVLAGAIGFAIIAPMYGTWGIITWGIIVLMAIVVNGIAW